MDNPRPPIRIEELLPGAPAREALDRIADRWTVLIAIVLEDGPTRFNEIRRRIGISGQALTRSLRELEQDGLVERRAYLEVPVRVEYRLTPLGETMCPVLHAIRAWSERVAAEIAEARARYDARATEPEDSESVDR